MVLETQTSGLAMEVRLRADIFVHRQQLLAENTDYALFSFVNLLSVKIKRNSLLSRS